MGSFTPADFTGLADTIYSFTVNEFGEIGNDADGNICGNVGEEFNPLMEKLYNVPNPYADPSRGAIDNQTIVEPTDGSTSFGWTQAKFMQNLAGKNSIIGKSIVVNDVTDPLTPAT